MYGVHLDKPVGKNNGVIDGKKYFGPVPALCGVFVPMAKVSPAKRVSGSLPDELNALTTHCISRTIGLR